MVGKFSSFQAVVLHSWEVSKPSWLTYYIPLWSMWPSGSKLSVRWLVRHMHAAHKKLVKILSCCQYAIMTQTRSSNKERPLITLSLSLSHLYESSTLHLCVGYYNVSCLRKIGCLFGLSFRSQQSTKIKKINK